MNSIKQLGLTRNLGFILFMVILIPMSYADYDAEGVELLGRYAYGYCPTAVAQGEFVYSANGTVLDILDIHTLDPVGELTTESIVSTIAIQGNFAYIANWSNGLQVVDVSDAANPELVASLEFEGQCWDISIAGEYAYIGNDTSGLQIVNITNPLEPTIAATFAPDVIAGFEYTHVIDTIAYASTKQGLYILNVSDPSSPTELGFSPSESGSWHVHVVDTIAYLPEFQNGIRMVNVADPENPIELGYFPTPGTAYWIEVVDTIAYVAAAYEGLEILDVSDLTAPDSIGIVNLGYADGIHIQGDSLYLAASSWGLKQFNINDLTAPLLINEYAGGGYAQDIYVSEFNTFVALRGLGVGVFSYNETSEPEMIGLLEMDSPGRMSGFGDFIYLTENSDIHIVDVSDPSDLQIVSTWYEGAALTSCVMSNLLFVGGHPDLQILDISDPFNPTLLGEFNGLPWVPFDIQVQGAFAYVVNRGGGFWIIDIRNPASPELLGGSDNFDYVWRLDVAGQYAYLADRYHGDIRCFDVSNPMDPFETALINIGDLAQDIVCSGRYVYGVDAWEGIRVIDFGDPYNPAEVGHFNTGSYAQGVFAHHGLLSVTDGGGGFFKLQTGFKMSSFTVNSTGDGMDAIPGDGICDDGSGNCTFRAAINESNATPGYNKIVFDIEGAGPHTIQPSSVYQQITSPVFIDGTTEPDFSGEPVIELNGSLLEVGHGINISTGFNKISSLVINGFDGFEDGGIESSGIYIEEGTNNVVQDCFIGTDIEGATSVGNWHGIFIPGPSKFTTIGGNSDHGNLISGNVVGGIAMYNGAYKTTIQGNLIGCDQSALSAIPNNIGVGGGIHGLIGGSTDGVGNIISGNSGPGVEFCCEEDGFNRVIGNYIGTDVTGLVALGNDTGINILSESNQIGGISFEDRNLISGNLGNGIDIGSPDMPGTASSNQIIGNYIGTDVSGTSALPNGGIGISVAESPANTIGGLEPGVGNTISGNLDYGIQIIGSESGSNIIQGNHVGTDASGTAPLGNGGSGINLRDGASNNLIGGSESGAGNVISCNARAGIVGTGGATANIIHGNFIGTDAQTQDLDLGNERSGVVFITGSNGNAIGGRFEGEGNHIAFNGGDGIQIRSPEDAFEENQNRISGNSIHHNLRQGIDLFVGSSPLDYDGMTPNDIGDGDEGPNRLQNYPENVSCSIDDNGDVILDYFVDSTPENAAYPLVIEAFISDEDGEGMRFLFRHRYWEIDFLRGGKVRVLGHANDLGVELGDLLVATAMDLEGNSSEFSAICTTAVFTPPESYDLPGLWVGYVNSWGEPDAPGYEWPGIFLTQEVDSPWRDCLFFTDDGQIGWGVYIPPDTEPNQWNWGNYQVRGNSMTVSDLSPDGFWNGTLGYSLEYVVDYPRTEGYDYTGWSIQLTHPDAGWGDHTWHLLPHSAPGLQPDVADLLDPQPLAVNGKSSNIPKVYTLSQNFPNPFNPTTTIRYGLPESSDVSLVIYDLTGRVVFSYSEVCQTAGWVNLIWDGTTSNGEPVSAGVYLCRLVAGEYSQSIKLVFLK